MYLSLRKINPRSGLRGGPYEQLTGAPPYKGRYRRGNNIKYGSSEIRFSHAPPDKSGEM
jgi:hypothetical protein